MEKLSCENYYYDWPLYYTLTKDFGMRRVAELNFQKRTFIPGTLEDVEISLFKHGQSFKKSIFEGYLSFNLSYITILSLNSKNHQLLNDPGKLHFQYYWF